MILKKEILVFLVHT